MYGKKHGLFNIHQSISDEICYSSGNGMVICGEIFVFFLLEFSVNYLCKLREIRYLLDLRITFGFYLEK